jgi:Thioredoxin
MNWPTRKADGVWLPHLGHNASRTALIIIAVLLFMLLVVAWLVTTGGAYSRANSTAAHSRSGPPWVYGRTDARFTIVVYADLTCPYCRQYLPTLQRWIDGYPDVNLQWHHLPLASHGAEALRLAQLTECAGITQGNTAFWRSVAWVLENEQKPNSRGLSNESLPGWSDAVRSCTQSSQSEIRIREQMAAAARSQITATPTLQMIDRRTGTAHTMRGIVEGDTLLSGIDGLLASGQPSTASE